MENQAKVLNCCEENENYERNDLKNSVHPSDMGTSLNTSTTENEPKLYENIDVTCLNEQFAQLKMSMPNQVNIYSTESVAGCSASKNIIISAETENSDKGNSCDELVQSKDQIKIYYCSDGSSCVLILKYPNEICIKGKVSVTLLGGSAEILGFTLKDKTYDVFSFDYLPEPIKTLKGNCEHPGLFEKLLSSGLDDHVSKNIVTSLNSDDVVVKLQKLISNKIVYLEDNSNMRLFNNNMKDVNSYFMKASQIIKCSLYNYMTNDYSTWDSIISANSLRFRGIITGGKGTKKTLFVKYSINKLLKHGPVLLIDLDPGQSTLTPAGCVSATIVQEPIIGPNFLNLKTPNISFNVGLVNVLDNSMRYINAIRNLIVRCSAEKQYENLPWIVNTMGLNDQCGLKIITFIILLFRPTFVVQMEANETTRNFDSLLSPLHVGNLFSKRFQNNVWFKNINLNEIDYSFYRVPTKTCISKINSKLNRYLSFLAYFGDLLERQNVTTILELNSYKAPLARFSIGLSGKSKLNIRQIASTEELLHKIVALCESDPGKHMKHFKLKDEPLHCYGYGYVRDIDSSQHVYIVTPVSKEDLMKTRVLLYGSWLPDLFQMPKRRRQNPTPPV